MRKRFQESQEHGEPRLAAMQPPRWVPLSGTVLDHARTLGLTLTDIGVMTSIRTLQEGEGYTRLSLSQIAALAPLDTTPAIARSIAHMQQLGLLSVTAYEQHLCSYDFAPLYQRCAGLLREEAGEQGAALLAAYQEAGLPGGATLGGLYAWFVSKQQEACQEDRGERWGGEQIQRHIVGVACWRPPRPLKDRLPAPLDAACRSVSQPRRQDAG
jgi:hypothetical protein